MRRSSVSRVVVAGVVACMVAGAVPAGADGRTHRVSVSSRGRQANGGNTSAAISADGRFIAFATGATNLVSGDTNGSVDIVVHDRATGRTSLVTRAADGSGADGDSGVPSISADGRFIAFASLATNLVPGDTNDQIDVFVRDTQRNVTVRASRSSDGIQGDGPSGYPIGLAIAPDGRSVAFTSFATNLVPGDTNGTGDVFIHQLRTGTTTRVSVGPAGEQLDEPSVWPSLSWDGSIVAFASRSAGLVPEDTNRCPDLYTGGTMPCFDVFVRDLRTGGIERVSDSSDGAQGEGESGYGPFAGTSISHDGRVVAFLSRAENLVPGDTNDTMDVFAFDRVTRQIRRVSVTSAGQGANGWSEHASVSPDGRYVAFASDASNLALADVNLAHDVFVHDLQSGTTTLASLASEGAPGLGDTWGSLAPSIATGGIVAFHSGSMTLVAGDTNLTWDVFVHMP